MGAKADAVQQELDRFKQSCVAEIRAIDRGDRGVHMPASVRRQLLGSLGLTELYEGRPAPTPAAGTPRVGDRLEEGTTWRATWGAAQCRQHGHENDGQWVCTRPSGHSDGPHVAYGMGTYSTGRVLEVWE